MTIPFAGTAALTKRPPGEPQGQPAGLRSSS
jgi:hypothetical protein